MKILLTLVIPYGVIATMGCGSTTTNSTTLSSSDGVSTTSSGGSGLSGTSSGTLETMDPSASDSEKGEPCVECEDCEGDCIVRCPNWVLIKDDCEVTCQPPSACQKLVDMCECESDLCGPDHILLGFDKLFGVCGDVICGESVSICESQYFDCSPSNPDCELGEKCAPISIYGDPAPEWTACIPSGDGGDPGESCVPNKYLDECRDDAVCIIDTCYKTCEGASYECPEGFYCDFFDNWFPICLANGS